MSYVFVNRPSVKEDISEAVKYYNNISPKLAVQFLFQVREAKAYIAKTPLGFQTKYNVVRTLLLRQFPYHIHYFIDEEKKVIVILAVIHSYRNPKDYSLR